MDSKKCWSCGGEMAKAPEFGSRWWKCGCGATYDEPQVFAEAFGTTPKKDVSVFGMTGSPAKMHGPGKATVRAGRKSRKSEDRQLRF